MFCTTCELVSSLACICPHGSQAHQQIAGVRTDSGAYLSRYTAEYPPLLATAFAKCIIGLIDHQGRDFSLDDVEQQVPCKPLRSPPFVRQDGGGLTSCGDWSHPPSKASDILQVLRQHWIHQIISQRLDKQLTHHFQNRMDSPPFSDEQLQPFKRWLEEFLEAHGEAAKWTVPADQPMRLFILQSFQRLDVSRAFACRSVFRLYLTTRERNQFPTKCSVLHYLWPCFWRSSAFFWLYLAWHLM